MTKTIGVFEQSSHIFLTILILAGLYLTSLYHYLLFHSLAEIFSIVIAFCIFLIAWNSKKYIENNYLIFIAIAYLFIGSLDLLHTLSYKGMGIFIDYNDYATKLWIAARYIESITLLVGFIFLAGFKRVNLYWLIWAYALIFTLTVASIFYWKLFPDCFIEGQGLTSFKKISEYVISLILLLDIWLLFKNQEKFTKDVFKFLIWSFVFAILSELAFTFYISSYGFSNLVGHYFKIFSFYFVYKAIIQTGLRQPYDLIFRELSIKEKSLEEAKKAADSANLAKSRFLANMSHELRTPLNGILGYAQILKRDPDALTSQQHGLDVIEQSGSHLLTLIDDVLDLAKVESGKIELYQSDFSLTSLIRGVSEIIRIRAEREGITFCLEKSANLPAGVHGDEKRLRQILLNLLGNAVKFTAEGSVTFRIQDCGLQNADSKDLKSEISKIRFAVEDTGIGITPEDLKNIFDPFQQAGGPGYKAKGTGLGLAISRNLAELMGSRLYVESQIGSGSTFRFDLTLPVVQYKSEIQETRQIIGIKGKPPTILTVDDNRENRMVLLNMLRPLGFNVLEAVNGRDGLEKAIDSQPDLIITDLVMPEMDGFELIRRIRQAPELQKVIIFTVSASAFAEDKTRSVTMGSDAFLPKPVQAERLFEELEHHLNLTWLERKPVEVPDPSDLPIIFPPPETIAELYESAMDGEIGELAERVSALTQSDARLEPFINKMNRLIKIYQLGRISEWLAPHIK